MAGGRQNRLTMRQVIMFGILTDVKGHVDCYSLMAQCRSSREWDSTVETFFDSHILRKFLPILWLFWAIQKVDRKVIGPLRPKSASIQNTLGRLIDYFWTFSWRYQKSPIGPIKLEKGGEAVKWFRVRSGDFGANSEWADHVMVSVFIYLWVISIFFALHLKPFGQNLDRTISLIVGCPCTEILLRMRLLSENNILRRRTYQIQMLRKCLTRLMKKFSRMKSRHDPLLSCP